SVYLSWTANDTTVKFESLRVDAAGRFNQTTNLKSADRSGPVGITAVASHSMSDWRHTTLRAGGFTNLRLCVKPGVSLSGRVLNSSGAPAANVEMHTEALFPPIAVKSSLASRQ